MNATDRGSVRNLRASKAEESLQTRVFATEETLAPKAFGAADSVLAAVVVGLIAFGVVMVYSASAVWANRQFDNGQYYLVRQSVYAALGLVVIVAVARIDYRY
ncbi:MAG: FtsW/RodA/SpoVE family cell cycle protein, partial [Myxococcota bacterium]